MNEKTYIAIIGSREFPSRQQVVDYVNALPLNTVIVSGGARGVDTWAQIAAEQRGLETIIYPAQWDIYGKSAGFRRNHDIIKRADKVVCFWNGSSRGSQHSIKLALQYGKPIEVFRPNPLYTGRG